MTTARAYIKRADKARNFPTNTCPASRHAQIIGEMLIQKKSYPMLHEEPEHCGETILSVVTSLYLARTEIEKLKKKLSRGKEERAKVLAALNIGRIVAQDDDGNYTREITPKRITEAIAIMRKEPISDAEMAARLRSAWQNHTGHEPSESILASAIDDAAALLEKPR